MKKNGAAWLALALLLGQAGAAAAAPGASLSPSPPSIALKGSVMRGLYARPGGASREPTYHVELSLQNLGATPLTFDVAEAAWLTPEEKGLRARTTRKGRVWRLDEGDSAEYEFDSDGYSRDLLRDANGGPLFFQVTLFSNGKVVAGPFRALLPPLARAPDYAAVKSAEREGGSVRVLYLRFVAGRPAPVRSPKAPAISGKA